MQANRCGAIGASDANDGVGFSIISFLANNNNNNKTLHFIASSRQEVKYIASGDCRRRCCCRREWETCLLHASSSSSSSSAWMLARFHVNLLYTIKRDVHTLSNFCTLTKFALMFLKWEIGPMLHQFERIIVIVIVIVLFCFVFCRIILFL